MFGEKENNMSKNTQLEKDGWENRGVFDDPKLSDVVEIYEEMGFEVRLEPFEPEEESGCVRCMMLQPDKYKTVFVRKTTKEL